MLQFFSDWIDFLSHFQVIHESVPIPLEGHQHEIECLHSSDNLVNPINLFYIWISLNVC